MQTWRAKQYKCSLTSSHRLTVTFRKFRVSKQRQSKLYKQWVCPVHMCSIRQVAIRYQRLGRRSSKKSRLANTILNHPATPILMLSVGLFGLAGFTIQASLSSQLKPAKSFTTTALVQKRPAVMPRSEPTHITIASVGIDADIKPVGRDSNGAIELPSVYDWITGWYKDSPTPGQIGPSIIVGHVDKPNGISVFWKLRDVKPGDIVAINRADGRVAKFQITALKQFDQSNFPSDQVYGNIDYAGLRLITCGGAFDRSTGAYTQNTVVYGTLLSQ